MRLIVFLLLLVPGFAAAQSAATLVADHVTIGGQDQLIASGNIEVFYDGTTLRASRIVYDAPTDRLTIDGPIVIRDPDGTVLTASQATLDPRLQSGILLGARLVLNQQLQIAANQINQTESRYAQLYKTAATSCRVCGTRAPLWEIRAERVVRDADAQQLYFENATFRVRGVPVIWLPRMRLPEPGLDRSNGFLIPRQRNTSQLGSGIKIPYFLTLGNDRDVTVTPYVSSQTRTLELTYRQAFARGDLRIEGAVSDDTLQDGLRSYVFVQSAFRLPDDYQFGLHIEAVSDPAYLLDYAYSDKDRLNSGVSVLRVTDSTLRAANLTYYQTLRDDESNASLPPLVADAAYETRLRPDFGGTLTLRASMDAAHRYSTVDGPAGRDVTRAGLESTWRQDWVLDSGIIGSTAFGARGDLYHVDDDSSFPANDLRFVPSAELHLRYPLARIGANGAAHMIEPTLSLGWADSFGSIPPNEDSTRSELDRANLLDTQRFTGDDAVETGAQAAVGLTWTRIGPQGTTSTLTFGRIFRNRTMADFSPSSGLDGATSDWLIGGQVVTGDGFLFDTRTLLDGDLQLTRADNRIAWRNDAIDLAAAYIWQARDLTEDRPETVSEWTLDAGIRITPAWAMTMAARYDIAADRPVRAGVGFEWRNECVTIEVSASRRYTSSSTVDPTTTFGLAGSLTGFSAGRSQGGPAAACKN
ncbi:LPS assembly protein LptD [Yoonia sp.]|uniref:LPS-assembly protein LptD n=1 Tax=Yoonia sp. TaxID=2212373 RepID=UPI001A014160|nr:LPS assembly protein LptD [Yoonia sp.]MBE0412867.1 LPS-assembly protein LptD [Yoonia sp.]